jgi:hypothetical protein
MADEQDQSQPLPPPEKSLEERVADLEAQMRTLLTRPTRPSKRKEPPQ